MFWILFRTWWIQYGTGTQFICILDPDPDPDPPSFIKKLEEKQKKLLKLKSKK